MPDEHTTTDPIQEEGGHYQGRSRYGFLATLIGLPKLEARLKEFLMARLDPINTALGNASAALTDLGAQITQLAAQIAELQAGSVTQEEIDATAASAQTIADNVTAAAASVDAAIEPDAGEGEPPVEPPVEPTP